MGTGRFSDLVMFRDGRPLLPEAVHPLADLLELSAEGVLATFRRTQRDDFTRVVAEVERPGAPLHTLFQDMRRRAGEGNPFQEAALFRAGALQALFLELHDHVMGHPVWRHPFFVRMFEGRASVAQVRSFATAYFNQIKNTRQCVAMAVGRFHSLMDLPYGPVNEAVSEITQIALAQLVADEYGVGAEALESYPPLAHLFLAPTHISMYRQVFAGLGIPSDQQDVPMLWGVADNVLVQRLVASHPDFSPLEALSSVGLGMEWGVPEFFSLLLGGLIKVAMRDDLALTAKDLEVFIAHVRYDVLHAVSVMLVTSLHMTGPKDLGVVKNACNTLMAARFAMMTDMHGAVFGERCATLVEYGVEDRYRVSDRRIVDALILARSRVPEGQVVDGGAYGRSTANPFPMT